MPTANLPGPLSHERSLQEGRIFKAHISECCMPVVGTIIVPDGLACSQLVNRTGCGSNATPPSSASLCPAQPLLSTDGPRGPAKGGGGFLRVEMRSLLFSAAPLEAIAGLYGQAEEVTSCRST